MPKPQALPGLTPVATPNSSRRFRVTKRLIAVTAVATFALVVIGLLSRSGSLDALDALAAGHPAAVVLPAPNSTAPNSTAAESSFRVTHIVDGDTLDVDDGRYRVRLLGIDTPERGQCGFAEATEKLRALVDGQLVNLVTNPDGDDFDRFGRKIAYVDIAGVDAGAELIRAGLAIPRYNSTDGFAAHPREAHYAELAVGATLLCPPIGLDAVD